MKVRVSQGSLKLINKTSLLTWTAKLTQNTELKFFHDNLTLPKSTEKCLLEWDLNSHFRDTGPPLYLLSCRVHRDWRRVFIQFKRTRYSRNSSTLIYEKMCSVLIQLHIKIVYIELKNWIDWSGITVQPNGVLLTENHSLSRLPPADKPSL